MRPAALLRPTETPRPHRHPRRPQRGHPAGGGNRCYNKTPPGRRCCAASRGQGRDVHLGGGTGRSSPTRSPPPRRRSRSPQGRGNAGPHRGHQDPALHPAWIELAGWHAGVFLKLVDGEITTESRGAWVWDLTQLGVPKARIWMMPPAATRGQLDLRWATILETAADAGVNATDPRARPGVRHGTRPMTGTPPRAARCRSASTAGTVDNAELAVRRLLERARGARGRAHHPHPGAGWRGRGGTPCAATAWTRPGTSRSPSPAPNTPP